MNKAVIFVCGNDDFLVNAKGQLLFDKASEGLDDSFAKEIIEGRALNVSEVETALSRFREATQTLSLFGDKKAVWFKNVNFLMDSQTGKAEATKTAVTKWQEDLNQLSNESIQVVITASPVDRRTKEYKWFQKNTDHHFIDDKEDEGALKSMVVSRCQANEIILQEEAWQTLMHQLGGNSRILIQEVDKLITYLSQETSKVITPELILDMVPAFGEGDFFETASMFYTFDLGRTLEALKKHFFHSKEARPLLASLQNKNRVLLQLKVLLDAKQLKFGYRGLDKASFEAAAHRYKPYFKSIDQKSSLNLFTQNMWYLGKLTEIATKTTLKKLVDLQLSFVWAYEELLKRPQEPESVMKALAIKCLG